MVWRHDRAWGMAGCFSCPPRWVSVGRSGAAKAESEQASQV